jgi:Tol biopolymer transport system component
VPLNLLVQVVFSEPIDAASLTPQNFVLRSSGGDVAGQLAFATANHTVVQFTPSALLAPGTDYELVVRPGILDTEGSALEAGASVTFTTAPTVTGSVAQDLAFVRDGQIYLLKQDGGLLQLTEGAQNADPAWSPDGQQLAFSSDRGGSWDIWTMDANGGNLVRRTHGGYNLDPAWSPDGGGIVFSSQILSEGLGNSMGLAMVATDWPALGSWVLLDGPGYDVQPAWSPDGRKITFTSDWRAYDFAYDIYIMNADGSDVRPLLLGPFFSPNQQYYFQLAWAPDGSQFAVVACAWNYADCYPDPSYPTPSTIVVANADGSGLRVVAQAGGYAKPTWSRDGRVIAFSSTDCYACRRSLRFVQLDGTGGGEILTNGHSPAWRP